MCQHLLFVNSFYPPVPLILERARSNNQNTVGFDIYPPVPLLLLIFFKNKDIFITRVNED